MLSISSPIKGAGRGNYYLELTRADYYANTYEQPGQWFGSGAGKLGLQGAVEREPFLNLLSGCAPDGRRPLVQNALHPDRQSGWDLTFSAPKSVSVLWVMAPEEVRQQIEQIHQEAVECGLRYMEETAGITRRGKGGVIKEPAKMMFATFQHSCSRALDPQLHTHAVLINLALRKDGTTGTLKTNQLFREKMNAGAFYQGELAGGLQQRLGLTIEPAKVAFHVQGVPHELCREFSKRRRQIERTLKERGHQGAVAAKVAALDTRTHKEQIPRARLFTQWQEVGQQWNWGPAQTAELLRAGQSYVADRKEYFRLFNQQIHEAKAVQSREKQTQSRKHQSRPNQSRKGQSADRGTRRPGFDHKTWQSGEERIREHRKQGLIHVEWPRLFPKAPFWSPFKQWKIPVVVVGRRPQRWGYIQWRKKLPLYELRVQDRFLFPRAPRWSPLHRIKTPALHIVRRPSLYEHTKHAVMHAMGMEISH